MRRRALQPPVSRRQAFLQLLRQAFSELLIEKPFDKITVTDVAERADLSRGTFYAHYDSTADLLNALTGEITDKLFELVDTAVATGFLKNPDLVIALVSDYLTQEKSLYRTLIGTPAADSFVAQMKHSLIDLLLERVEPGDVFANDLERQLCVTYVSGGLVDICCAWLRGDFGDADVDEVCATCSQLVRSVRGMAG